MVGKPTEQLLEVVGNTVREQAHRRGVHAVLVIGQSLTCHFWLNILPVARDQRVQHFINLADLELTGRMDADVRRPGCDC
jgi:hypothetical protein